MSAAEKLPRGFSVWRALVAAPVMFAVIAPLAIIGRIGEAAHWFAWRNFNRLNRWVKGSTP